MVKKMANETPPVLGKTLQRLRKAYNMSLGDLAEQSGVAKSIISQIERNETNPTLATIWRLSQALETNIEGMLRGDERPVFIEHTRPGGIPQLRSEDGLCQLSIIGWLNTVDWVQWYWFEAEPLGVRESEPHQAGSVENLSVAQGSLQVTIEDQSKIVQTGETQRYRGDLDHVISNPGSEPARAIMVNILKTTVMDG
jgi:transcriptional regulator with XRE-family HTH domain